MNVRFDLRTSEFLEHERKSRSFNFIRLISVVLMLAFIVTSGVYLASAFWEVRVLQSNIEQQEIEVSSVEAGRVAMLAEISSLKRKEEDYRRSLRIMQNEPATLEALSALEMNMETGVAFTSVRFVPVSGAKNNNSGATIRYNVIVDGSALSEGQITSLMEGLRTCGVFGNVAMPSSQRGNNGNVNFNLVLDLLPVGQIGQS